jgi:hypothetical protein
LIKQAGGGWVWAGGFGRAIFRLSSFSWWGRAFLLHIGTVIAKTLQLVTRVSHATAPNCNFFAITVHECFENASGGDKTVKLIFVL